MARADAEALKPLLPVLRQLREIKGVQETQPGMFYARRDAFIHFHDEGGVLHADLKKPGGAASTASRWPRRPSSASSSTKRSCARAARRRMSASRAPKRHVTDFFERSRRATPARARPPCWRRWPRRSRTRRPMRRPTLNDSPASSLHDHVARRARHACRCCASTSCSTQQKARAQRPVRRLRGDRLGPRAAARAARGACSSPGPIHEPEGARADYWRMGRALFAAGFRAGDLVHNSFSYHFTPAGAMMESGAHALGCTVFPAGTGQTEQQVQAMAAAARAATSARRASCASFSRRPTRSASRCRRWPRPRSAAKRSRRALRDWLASAASPPTRATAPPTSAWSPTKPRRARGWSSTRA